ncbi:MAG: hypothetical protein Q7S33_05950 [Nanoarchaeota archaeon]|nr:hypothetical protein [Nanoarchaeota archaeon]
MFQFLFYLFLIGVCIASFQDLQRREVDNWLNLFLIISSLGFIFISSIFLRTSNLIFFASCSMIIMFILANLFYYGRVFAGGDAKLLFSMFVLFTGLSFYETFVNILLFLGFLLISGSIWGVGFSLYLFFKNPRNIKLQFNKEIDNSYAEYFLGAGAFCIVLSFFNIMFLFFSMLFFIFPLLFAFARAVEKTSMTKSINARDLREGDWLVNPIKMKNKTIIPNWEGLRNSDLVLLRKLNKKVMIKEGIPFVPSFLIALLLYVLFRNDLYMLLFNIF